MVCTKIGHRERNLITMTAIIIAVILYLILSYKQKLINPLDKTIPNLIQFWHGVITLTHKDPFGRVWLFDDLTITYIRHFVGMLCGAIASIIIGISMGCFPRVEAALHLLISWLGNVPPTAMIAVYFVLFGIDFEFYIAAIALGILPSLSLTIYQSVKSDVNENLIHKAYTLGASDTEVILHIVFNQILPRIIDAIRLMSGPALVILIAAEWYLADIGVGYRLKIQSRASNMNIVYIYLVILCLTSYIINWSLLYCRRKLCPWFNG